MIFRQFIEHFHRQIYGGIFEPGSPLSDKDGFLVAALKELRVENGKMAIPPHSVVFITL